MNLQEAVETDDRRTILLALRQKLAEQLDYCESGRDVASISKRLMEVCAELDAIPDDGDESPLQRARKIYGS